MKNPTLCIGLSNSKCLNCNREAFPSEKSHDTLAGYGAKPGDKGCGITWTCVTTGYAHAEEATKQLRPDLEFISWFDIERELIEND